MGLDISKITNAVLKSLAHQCDVKDDKFGILNKEEFIDFKTKGAQLKEISAEDFNQACGLYINSEKDKQVSFEQTTSSEKVVTDPNSQRNNVDKQTRKDIKNDIEALLDGKKSARLKEDSTLSLYNLAERLTAKNSNPRYQAAIAEVKSITDKVISTNFNSKKDVENLKKLLEKENLTDLQKSIIDYIVDLAKLEQVNKEADVLIGIYNEIKKDTSKEQNFSQYLDDVKEEMKNRGLKNTSYYSDEAFDALESVVKQDASVLVDTKRQDMLKNGENIDSERGVTKDLKNSTPKSDKITRKIIKKEKDLNGVTARFLKKNKRAEEIEHISESELKSILGKELFNILDRQYLYKHKNENGSYNVRDLSDKLFERVGYDVWMNMSDDTQMSELQGAKNELKVLTGRDLNDKDIKKIMKLVHIEREPKNRNLLDAIKKTIIPGLAGGIASAATTQKLHVTQRVQIVMDMSSAAELSKQLTAAGVNAEVTNNGNGKVTITVLQEILKDDRILNALAGVGIGVLTGTLMNLIFGMENNEKSCISIADFDLNDEKYTNIEKYEEYVRNIHNPQKADLIVALAKTYEKEYGEDWAKHYDSDLKKFAGRGSVLNCLEFRSGKLFSVINKDEANNNNNNNENNTVTNETHTYSTTDKDPVKPTYEDAPAIDGSKTSWAAIARQYDCLVEKYTLMGAIRILKIAQAITNGDYSEENLDKLYKLSLKGASAMKNIEGFDYETYHNVLTATSLSKLEMKDGKPIAGTGVKVPARLGDCDRNSALSLKVDRMAPADNPVKSNGHKADRIKTSNGQEGEYTVSFDCGPRQTFKTKAERDNAVADFKSKHKKVEERKCEQN